MKLRCISAMDFESVRNELELMSAEFVICGSGK
jgi:hypothetical protein